MQGTVSLPGVYTGDRSLLFYGLNYNACRYC